MMYIMWLWNCLLACNKKVVGMLQVGSVLGVVIRPQRGIQVVKWRVVMGF